MIAICRRFWKLLGRGPAAALEAPVMSGMIPGLLKQPLRMARLEPQPDVRGGWSEGWSLRAETLGRSQPLRGRTLDLGGRLHAEVSHALYLPPETEARIGDRV